VANGKVDLPAARRLAVELTTGDAGATAGPPITAIAFDMGGVLTTSALGGLDRLAGELGLPAGSISAYFRGDARMASLEIGQMSAREFFKYVCVELEAEHGQRIDIRRLAAAAEEGQVLNPEMIEIVRRLHEGFATALVTNNVAEASWRATFPFDLFDVVLDSSAVGVRKPDPRFYDELLGRLDRPAAEVVVVDDFEENLAPAAERGLATIHFTGIDAFRDALGALGVAEPFPHKEHRRP
jgi:epoxide hydrolase-like predicted phosphatase